MKRMGAAILFFLGAQSPALAETFAVEQAAISAALKEYPKIYEAGQKYGWTSRRWIENTALAGVPNRDSEFLWKAVNLHGPLLPAKAVGTKLLFSATDKDARTLRTIEVDYRDIVENKLYVNGVPYEFEFLDPLDSIYEKSFLKHYKKFLGEKHSSSFHKMMQIIEALYINHANAAPGCTEEDGVVAANAGAAGLSIASTVVNPVNLCAKVGMSAGAGMMDGYKNGYKSGLNTFGNQMTSEFRTIGNSAAYCKARWGSPKGTDIDASSHK